MWGLRENIIFEIWKWQLVRHNHIKIQNVQFRIYPVVLIVGILIFIMRQIQALQTLWVKCSNISQQNADQNYGSEKYLIWAQIVTKLVCGKIHKRRYAPKSHHISYLFFDIQLVMLYFGKVLKNDIQICYFKPINE